MDSQEKRGQEELGELSKGEMGRHGGDVGRRWDAVTDLQWSRGSERMAWERGGGSRGGQGSEGRWRRHHREGSLSRRMDLI